MSNEEEVWKQYPDYPFIEASNLGRVRTKDRYVTVKGRGKRFVKGRILKQQLHKNSYMYINFRVNGKFVTLRVHRMVAICFLSNPNDYPEVNHIDNDPKNNAASNLEWCTRQYNEDYKNNFGTTSVEVFGRPVIAVNSETSEAFWFESQSEAARQLGVDQSAVAKVAKGKRRYKTAGGCWFTYADGNATEKTRSKFGDEITEKVERLISEHKKV